MDSEANYPYDVHTEERYGSREAALKRGFRTLFASCLELCFSAIVIVYGILQGAIFRNFISGLLFGVVGITMIQMGWLLLNGYRSNSVFLLRLHAYLALFYATATLAICIVLCFCNYFNVGIFRYFRPRISIQAHILLGMCSLIPFIIGHRTSLIRAHELREYLIDNGLISNIA